MLGPMVALSIARGGAGRNGRLGEAGGPTLTAKGALPLHGCTWAPGREERLFPKEEKKKEKKKKRKQRIQSKQKTGQGLPAKLPAKPKWAANPCWAGAGAGVSRRRMAGGDGTKAECEAVPLPWLRPRQ